MVLAVGHITDVIMALVLVDCVTVTVVVTTFGFGDIAMLDGNEGF